MNQYKALEEKDSKWMRVAAVQETKCPLCGSDPGYYCETPAGCRSDAPHARRVQAMLKTTDYRRFQVPLALL